MSLAGCSPWDRKELETTDWFSPCIKNIQFWEELYCVKSTKSEFMCFKLALNVDLKCYGPNVCPPQLRVIKLLDPHGGINACKNRRRKKSLCVLHHVRTQPKDSHLQTRKRPHQILTVLAPWSQISQRSNCKNKFPLFQSLSLWFSKTAQTKVSSNNKHIRVLYWAQH